MQNYFTPRSHLMITIIGTFVLVLGLATPGFTVGPPDNPLDDILDLLGPCNIPPVWGKTYPLDQRFVPVLGGAAFCDKATGLVWEGSPDPNPQTIWDFAVVHCTTRTVGGQNGFHLPLIEQLASLLPLLVTELNSATGDGPFSNVVIADYWSATTRPAAPSAAWSVSFGDDPNDPDIGPGIDPKDTAGLRAWCVRGGQVFDGNTHNTLH